MTVAVRLENISKKYLLRHQKQERYVSLRDVLTNKVSSTFKSLRGTGKEIHQVDDLTKETFWALKDINLEIQQGDRIGIIGRNGAGKSTLLKLMSRIVEPTSGKISINGRIASLLEVGTGFHPELTGRENIFLNGAILGMRHQEIKRKFDAIVAFADVEKFLDTPVKHYSSGMYMRLAFSVAAHLDPEILVVDEVLAVGDAEFQKKCLGKMKEAGDEGRTVIFVSHSMPTITSLCSQCVLLDKGQIAKYGKPSEVVIDYYTNGGQSLAKVDFSSRGNTIGDEYVTLLEGSIKNKEDVTAHEVDIRHAMKISMRYRVNQKTNIRFIPNFHLLTASGIYAFVTSHEPVSLVPGVYVAECTIPGNFLNEGAYFVGLAISSFEPGLTVHFYEDSALNFNVKDPMEGSVGRYGYANVMPGVVRPHLNWAIHPI
jgi:lipopolysaccharide transport system ATP-binding protein